MSEIKEALRDVTPAASDFLPFLAADGNVKLCSITHFLTAGGVALTSQITLAAIETAAGVTPCADATVASPTSITTKKGIITAIS